MTFTPSERLRLNLIAQLQRCTSLDAATLEYHAYRELRSRFSVRNVLHRASKITDKH